MSAAGLAPSAWGAVRQCCSSRTSGPERLDFEIFQHLAVEDDGSRGGAQADLDRLLFVDRYLGNGKLELWRVVLGCLGATRSFPRTST
jgi:hypothetical protein